MAYFYDVEELRNTFLENNDGLNEEEFLKDRCNKLITTWIYKNPSFFRFSGMFWELLCPLLKKYAPEKFKELERMEGPFEYFDDKVREEIDYKDEILNFMAALRYMNERIDMMYTTDDIHYIEIDGDDYPYMPNQWLDKDFILGRGDWFD